MGFHFAAFALKDSAVKPDWNWYHDTFLGSENTSNTAADLRGAEGGGRGSSLAKRLGRDLQVRAERVYPLEEELRENPDITVLLSIDPSSFPLGTGPKPHEIWHSGDYPVAWTNKKHRMVYFNMGHNDIDYEGKTNKELSFTFKNEDQNKPLC